jgi:hypothetical protein
MPDRSTEKSEWPAQAESKDEYEAFEDLARKLVSVPKRDIDDARERERAKRNGR